MGSEMESRLAQIRKERDQAQASGDISAVAACNWQIASLEVRMVASR